MKARKVRCNNTGNIYNSIDECASDVGVSSTSIIKILKGLRDNIYGLTFSYVYEKPARPDNTWSTKIIPYYHVYQYYKKLAEKRLNIKEGQYIEHKDESLFYIDLERYCRWLDEDVVVLTFDEMLKRRGFVSTVLADLTEEEYKDYLRKVQLKRRKKGDYLYFNVNGIPTMMRFNDAIPYRYKVYKDSGESHVYENI